MKRVKYCCDTNALCDYYKSQAGSGINVFKGARNQSGYGIGSFFGGLFKSVLPLFKSAGRSIGRTALKSGLNIASDVLAGRNLKESAQEHATTAKHHLMEKASRKLGEMAAQSGNGRVHKRKRRRKDIFN